MSWTDAIMRIVSQLIANYPMHNYSWWGQLECRHISRPFLLS